MYINVIFMHITTFGRSLVVLRTLFTVQPQPALMPAELLIDKNFHSWKKK